MPPGAINSTMTRQNTVIQWALALFLRLLMFVSPWDE